MTDVYVAGVSMTRFGKQIDRSIKDLARDALEAVVGDAGCDRRDLQAAFFGNCVQGHMEGQDMVRGEIALRPAGIEGIPIVNVENACATASTAFHLATSYVRSGAADIVLAIGAEKMFSNDKARMFSAFDGAWDVHTVDANRDELLRMGYGVEVPPGTTSDRPYSVFMDVYAAFCRMHMREYGTTQRQIAAVAAKNHQHSVHNPLSQYQRPYTIDEILAGPAVTYPLTVPMCSPVSDGAAAAIVCNEAGLKRLGGSRGRAKRVLASVLHSGRQRQAEEFTRHISRYSAQRAFAEAGIGPRDVSLAEVHDATAMGEIIELEALELVPPGEGGAAAERGETALGGRLPVNPSGGLESKGHPIGATGLGQIYELVTQLRREAGGRQVPNARIALAQNGGGILGVEEAAVCVTIIGG